jgi:hypothetical protein
MPNEVLKINLTSISKTKLKRKNFKNNFVVVIIVITFKLAV